MLLGLQIEAVFLGGLHLDGYPLHDGQAEIGELVHLVRVVGEQAHGLHTQIAEDLGADVVLPEISGKAQGQVGLQGVHALILEGVGLQLVQQADAPALLPHVEEYAPALPFNLGHGGGQLLAAVAPQGAEAVAGEALGVNPAQHISAVPNVPLYQGHVVLPVEPVSIAVGGELAVPGGQAGDRHLLHQLLVPLAIGLKIPDGDEFQPPLLRLLLELGGAHHGAVVPHDLAAQAAGLQPRQPQEIHRGLGVARPLQHAVLPGQQGEHMAGPPEVLRPGAVIGAGPGGDRPLLGRDAGGGGHVVDGDGEGRLVVVRVVGHHLGEPEPLDEFQGHGHADEPLAVGSHEVDLLGGDGLGRADQIPLVLPIRVVGTQDHAALPQLLQGLFNGAVWKHRDTSSIKSRSAPETPG